MSYLPVNQEENQQGPTGQTTTPGQAGGAGSTAPPPQSGGSVGGGQAAGAPSGSSNGSPTQFGSSASKLGDYLSANAPQVTQQAGNLSNTLNTAYGQTTGDVTNAANQFGTQVQGGYTAANPNLVQQAAANPSDFASNANNVAGFQGQLNDTYTGPTSYEGSTPYSQVQNEVGQAVQNYGNLGNQAGLQTYLQNQGGNQTTGTTTLDTLLMQGNPAAQAQIAQASGQFGGLQGQLAGTATAQDQGVANAQQAAQQTAQNALGAFTGQNGALTNLNTQIGGELGTAQTGQQAATDQQAAILAGINSGTLTPQQLQAMGVTPDQYAALNAAENRANTSQYMTGHNFGAASNTGTTDLSPYLNQVAGAGPTAGTVATPQEYQQMAAIQQLLGTQTPTGNEINPANAAQAGTYNPNAGTNNFDYANALGGATTLGDQERAAAQQQANALTSAADLAHAQGQHGGIWNTVKNAISQPGKALSLNPMQSLTDLQNAAQGKTTTGDNPLPGAQGKQGKGFAAGGIAKKDLSSYLKEEDK